MPSSVYVVRHTLRLMVSAGVLSRLYRLSKICCLCGDILGLSAMIVTSMFPNEYPLLSINLTASIKKMSEAAPFHLHKTPDEFWTNAWMPLQTSTTNFNISEIQRHRILVASQGQHLCDLAAFRILFLSLSVTLRTSWPSYFMWSQH